jgi:hypothetical protein
MKLSALFLSSSVVERSAVNRLVVGSNPTWGDPSFFRNLLRLLGVGKTFLVIVWIHAK